MTLHPKGGGGMCINMQHIIFNLIAIVFIKWEIILNLYFVYFVYSIKVGVLYLGG